VAAPPAGASLRLLHPSAIALTPFDPVSTPNDRFLGIVAQQELLPALLALRSFGRQIPVPHVVAEQRILDSRNRCPV
jgi:hypothetical protein